MKRGEKVYVLIIDVDGGGEVFGLFSTVDKAICGANHMILSDLHECYYHIEEGEVDNPDHVLRVWDGRS